MDSLEARSNVNSEYAILNNICRVIYPIISSENLTFGKVSNLFVDMQRISAITIVFEAYAPMLHA